jgi:hypothetical protein
MKQAGHPILFRGSPQRDHQELLMISREIGVLEDRGNLELAGCDLVVPGFDRNTELEQFALAFEHEGEHPLGNRAEIVILEFLTFGRRRAEERTSRAEQVGTGKEEVQIDQEVLLLRARV